MGMTCFERIARVLMSRFLVHMVWRGSGFTAHSVQRLPMDPGSMLDKLGAVPNIPARVAWVAVRTLAKVCQTHFAFCTD